MRSARALLICGILLLVVNLAVLLVPAARAQKAAERAPGAPVNSEFWIFMPDGSGYPPLILNTRTGVSGYLYLSESGWVWRTLRAN